MNILRIHSVRDEPTMPDRRASGVSEGGLENIARLAIDRHAGRVLTDPEWARARTTIMDLVAILRRWEQEARADEYAQCDREAA
jgi:predicted nucleic acid-binding protein